MNARAVFLAALLGAAVGLLGCATPGPAPEAESVGQLAPTYHSIAVAPLKHDAPPELGEVVETQGDSAGEVVTTTTRVEADAAADGELPDVAPKDQGLKVGEAR